VSAILVHSAIDEGEHAIHAEGYLPRGFAKDTEFNAVQAQQVKGLRSAAITAKKEALPGGQERKTPRW
jgi:hypothetical protein